MPNRLSFETSPYLLQHKDNPVDWYPWGDEAFERARREDRPVLLSIGYSACHWCHVMEHESFENPEIAALMNRLFVSIKVDREERPDLDSIYMQVTQAMTRGGGWPMTVFLTPEGLPFYAGPRASAARPSRSASCSRDRPARSRGPVGSTRRSSTRRSRSSTRRSTRRTAASAARRSSRPR
jgi:uncharacterized protein YyaL (SSP411 family)